MSKYIYVFALLFIAVVMESQCEDGIIPSELGQFCLTPSQIDTLFNSGEGQWKALLGE